MPVIWALRYHGDRVFSEGAAFCFARESTRIFANISDPAFPCCSVFSVWPVVENMKLTRESTEYAEKTFRIRVYWRDSRAKSLLD
jgi:hypothetical protein